MPKINFSTIDHKTRVKLNLGLLEYCLADLVYNLCNNPKSVHPGWCYAKKQSMADNLDTSRQTVQTLLKKLKTKGLIEINMDTKFIKITTLWYENVVMRRGDALQDSPELVGIDALHGVKKLYTTSKETLHHIYDNDINNNNNDSKKIAIKNKSSDEINYYAGLLIGILKDDGAQSLDFYKFVCRRHDPAKLLQKAQEIMKDGGANNPGAVFNDWVKKL